MNNRQTNMRKTKNQFRRITGERIIEAKKPRVKREKSEEEIAEKMWRREVFIHNKNVGKCLRVNSRLKKKGGRDNMARRVVSYDMNVEGY